MAHPQRFSQEKPWIIRRYRQGDEEQINALYNRVFRCQRAMEEWAWKFERNPASKPQLIIIAEQNGTIIGQYATLPLMLHWGAQIVLSDQPMDDMVRPDFEGRGVLRDMFQLYETVKSEEGILFSFGFPTRAHYTIGKRWLGYNDLCELPVLYLRLNWRLAVTRRLGRLPVPLRAVRWLSARACRSLLRLKWLASFKSSKNPRIEAVEKFDARADEFWEKVKDGYQALIVRDQRYLNWRYVERPAHSYHLFIARRGEEMVGYAVLRIRPEGETLVGYILDMLALPEQAIEDALIYASLRFFCSRQVDFALCGLLAEDRSYKALARHGFKKRKDFPPLQAVWKFSPLGKERLMHRVSIEGHRWHFCLGDGDSL